MYHSCEVSAKVTMGQKVVTNTLTQVTELNTSELSKSSACKSKLEIHQITCCNDQVLPRVSSTGR